jgi:hypothetical protein
MAKKSYQPIIRIGKQGRGMVQVPDHLTPMQFSRYPSDNAVTFERWYLNNWTQSDERERVYLPIQWTALYCNNGYGNAPIKHTIQKFIGGLDRDKKYYTIIQYDDGILNDISYLDIKVCAMSGKQIDFSLPLLCTPHKFGFTDNPKRDIFASFVGNITHPIRDRMIKQLQNVEDYYISTKHHALFDYCQIMRRSKYALCPRGYGANSFRIQEAIDFGAIPVYISDEFIFPYNMPSFLFGPIIPVKAEEFDFFELNEALKAHDGVINKSLYPMMIEKNKSLYTYAGCKKEILNYLKDCDNDL